MEKQAEKQLVSLNGYNLYVSEKNDFLLLKQKETYNKRFDKRHSNLDRLIEEIDFNNLNYINKFGHSITFDTFNDAGNLYDKIKEKLSNA